jgi:integrase
MWEGLERHYRIHKRKSAECLGRRWKHLGAFFANMPACNLTYDRLEEYVDTRLSDQAQNATINREMSALKTAFRLGRKKQTVRQVPDFPHLTENNVRTGFLEDREYAALTAHCSELWMRLFLEIAYSFAWRKSEILNLRVTNVSLATRTIRLDVGATKSGEGREVTMTQRIAAWLSRQSLARAKTITF